MGLLKKGDRVVMPFNVACGRCLNCEEGRTAYVCWREETDVDSVRM